MNVSDLSSNGLHLQNISILEGGKHYGSLYLVLFFSRDFFLGNFKRCETGYNSICFKHSSPVTKEQSETVAQCAPRLSSDKPQINLTILMQCTLYLRSPIVS